MTFEEYKTKKELLLKKHKTEIFNLSKEYVMYHNNVIKGDVVSDTTDIIKVDKIGLCFSFEGKPQCFYLGYKLTKAGKLFKSKIRGRVSQERLKSINGKEILND